MSVDIVYNTSNTCAVLDFAKKIKYKKVCVPEEVQEFDSAIPLCAVVEKTKTLITSENTFEYAHDSTDLPKNGIQYMKNQFLPTPATCLSNFHSKIGISINPKAVQEQGD